MVGKVAAGDAEAVKADFWRIFDLDAGGDDAEAGQAAIAEARRRAEAFAARWSARYPRAVACVLDDLPVLPPTCACPREHWRRVRHTNLIERTFGETRRRVKVIGRLPGERSALSLVWAVLDRASRGWRGVHTTPATVRHLQRLRADLHGSVSAGAQGTAAELDAAHDEEVPDLPGVVTPAA